MLARRQHAAYCDVLKRAGLDVTLLPALDAFPDSVFVEDVAVVLPEGVVLCRPGAATREGEVPSIRHPVQALGDLIAQIAPPGTLDGGDVCDLGDVVLVGLSSRTNAQGIAQFSAALPRPVQAVALPAGHVLHLKTGMAYLGDGVVLCDERLRPHLCLPKDAQVLLVAPVDGYAANCIRGNDVIVMPSGYPEVETLIHKALPEVRIAPLDLSEFRKMDGGPSCLSLRG